MLDSILAHSNLCLYWFLGTRSDRILDTSTLGVASPIYRQRPWASSQILSGKGANNWPIQRGTSGTLILTKVGPRLPKALWWRRSGLHGDLLPTVGLVLVLLHRNGCLCLILSPALAPFAPKRKGERCAGWRPPGTLDRHGLLHGHLARYPVLISPPPREPA